MQINNKNNVHRATLILFDILTPWNAVIAKLWSNNWLDLSIL